MSSSESSSSSSSSSNSSSSNSSTRRTGKTSKAAGRVHLEGSPASAWVWDSTQLGPEASMAANMREQSALLMIGFLLPGLLLSEASKILTQCALAHPRQTFDSPFTISVLFQGGSHYLLMDRVSQILQDHGHNVTMLLHAHNLVTGSQNRKVSYQEISWTATEDFEKELTKFLDFFFKEAFLGRDTFENLMSLMEPLGERCNHLLKRRDIMDHLKNENFDLIFVDGVDFCSFLVAEKLGKPLVALNSCPSGHIDYGLPSPISYVPVFNSFLTDRMDFWGRVKNFLMFLDFSIKKWKFHSTFDNTIKRNFPEGSRPVLSHLLKKAELWFINSDFALEFAQPLLPNTVYIGGLLARPPKPVPQEFENFITKFKDSGFVLVAFGSVVDYSLSEKLLMEMNSALSGLPQGVIWKCKNCHWPKDMKLAANVKIVDWLPQNDLLAHPHIRLFVTHGGVNSVMEAIEHGVPIVGVYACADQPDNMVRIQAKNLGIYMHVKEMKAETLALKIKQVIGDQSFKSAAVAASVIRRSQPLTPSQRLVGWTNHILQTGGAAHLKPHVFQQSWYEQYMLDVFLFLLVVTLGTVWLCVKLLGLVVRRLGGRKLKKT
ncbi:UDP-glucuronosyltransferase 3A1 [Galemys pyrenaicus]|uniref:glucuronosyltransferase n=1 Tax=Galemys pyrenaicus TaxID=202257 RepID=A0A8J6AJK2_GALPY|nr:UDP-glucuronosyltransferase 3A1 [Galemys pyrenaicus]